MCVIDVEKTLRRSVMAQPISVDDGMVSRERRITTNRLLRIPASNRVGSSKSHPSGPAFKSDTYLREHGVADLEDRCLREIVLQAFESRRHVVDTKGDKKLLAIGDQALEQIEFGRVKGEKARRRARRGSHRGGVHAPDSLGLLQPQDVDKRRSPWGRSAAPTGVGATSSRFASTVASTPSTASARCSALQQIRRRTHTRACTPEGRSTREKFVKVHEPDKHG